MDLTDETEAKIKEWLDSHSRMPRNDRVSKWANCTIWEARQIINEFKRRYGLRIRRNGEELGTQGAELPFTSGEPDTGTGNEAEKPVGTPGHDRKWYDAVIEFFQKYATPISDWVVDKGTILVAVVLNLFLSALALYIMGPSDLEKVGFVAVAFIIVLFGFRALLKGNFWLWVRCELVAGFLGVSFVLVGIDYQTNLSADDRQLTALETAETNAKNYLETLQTLQKEKGEGYKNQVEAQQGVFNEASAKAGAYRVLVAGKPKEAPEIKAYDILLAIPKAVMGSAYKLDYDLAMKIALGLFFVVFWILPETLYTAVFPTKKKDFH